MATELYLDTANRIQVAGLRDYEGDYQNDVTVECALFHQTKKELDSADVQDDGGNAQITLTDHGLSVGDFVYLEGTVNYNGWWDVTDVTDSDTFTIDATYAEETFDGTEKLYQAVRTSTTWPIAMTYEAASDGDYYAILPEDMGGLDENSLYYLFVVAKPGTSDQLTARLTLKAEYR